LSGAFELSQGRYHCSGAKRATLAEGRALVLLGEERDSQTRSKQSCVAIKIARENWNRVVEEVVVEEWHRWQAWRHENLVHVLHFAWTKGQVGSLPDLSSTYLFIISLIFIYLFLISYLFNLFNLIKLFMSFFLIYLFIHQSFILQWFLSYPGSFLGEYQCTLCCCRDGIL
jgi:hypothetical protein